MVAAERKTVALPLLISVFIGTFIVSSMTMYLITRRVLEHHYASRTARDGIPAAETPAVSVSPSSVARTAAVLMQAPPDELTKRTLSFLLHQYQKQKVTIRDQAERMETLAAENRRLAEQLASLAQQIAALNSVNEPAAPVSDERRARAATEEKTEGDDGRRIKRVAELYNKMKPEEAQRIVSSIDDEDLLQLFAAMKPTVVARILALMDAERAARLSERMMQ